MAIDISSLQEYVKLHPELLTTTIRKDTIVQRLNDIRVYTNETPGPYKYRIFDPVANPGACCRIPEGNSNITERTTEIVCILDGQEYCETDLAAILRNADFRFTAGRESAGSIEEVITQGQINAFLIYLDKLIFQGDTAAVSELFTGQKMADGLLKIARTSGTTITGTEGDIYDVLLAAIRQVPSNARMMGTIGVFVGEEYGDYLQASYIGRNWYHFNPGTYAPYSENQLFGFGNIRIIPTPGLTGTNQILITPINNIVYFTNRTDDITTLDWDYSKYHQKYYWRLKTIFGIDLLIPEWSVVVTVDPAVLTNCPLCSAGSGDAGGEAPSGAPTTPASAKVTKDSNAKS